MSENPENSLPELAENALMNKRFSEFYEAVDVLYIPVNISGRIQFAQRWPAAAAHILGDALLHCDWYGAQDRTYKAALEEQAEARRAEMLELMDGVEGKSLNDGSLVLEYVRSVVEKLGRDLALCVYTQDVVDRFSAPPPEPVVEAAPEPEVQIKLEGGVDVEPKAVSSAVEVPAPIEAPVTPIDMAPEPVVDVKPQPQSEPDIVTEPVQKPVVQSVVKPVSPALVKPAQPIIPVKIEGLVQKNIQQDEVPAQEPKPLTQRPVSMKFVSSKDRKSKTPPEESDV